MCSSLLRVKGLKGRYSGMKNAPGYKLIPQNYRLTNVWEIKVPFLEGTRR